jgi:putative Mg2+ transporter-C (MgtC) family protein
MSRPKSFPAFAGPALRQRAGLQRGGAAANARLRGTVRPHIIYDNNRGVLRALLRVCGQRNWQLTELDADAHDIDRDQVGVTMTLSGAKITNAPQLLAEVDGVSAVPRAEDEPD